MKKTIVALIITLFFNVTHAELPRSYLVFLDNFLLQNKICPLNDSKCTKTKESYNQIIALGYCLSNSENASNIKSWSTCPQLPEAQMRIQRSDCLDIKWDAVDLSNVTQTNIERVDPFGKQCIVTCVTPSDITLNNPVAQCQKLIDLAAATQKHEVAVATQKDDEDRLQNENSNLVYSQLIEAKAEEQGTSFNNPTVDAKFVEVDNQVDRHNNENNEIALYGQPSSTYEPISGHPFLGTCCLILGVLALIIGSGKSDLRYSSGIRGHNPGLQKWGGVLSISGLLIIIIPLSLLISMGVFAIGSTVFYFFYKWKIQQETEQRNIARTAAILAQALNIIDQHKNELKIRRRQLTVTRNYGLVDQSKWIAEKDSFIKDLIVSQLGLLSDEILQKIYDRINHVTKHFDLDMVGFNNQMSGADYEKFVSDNLQLGGWSSYVTKGSGDQGVDIVATKGTVRIVVQCKRYSNYVDNKAVQEVFAGKKFENANFAVVVSNARFSNSARQLASATGVILLHHDELNKLDKLCVAPNIT